MTRYLGLADYLLIAEAVLDVPAEILVDVCDLPLAESALNAPSASFGGLDLYPTMTEKAAALTYRVCNNHALLDGNKRVAYECLREFLAINDAVWTEPVDDDGDDGDDETVKIMWGLAAGNVTEQALAEWIAVRIGPTA
jgi:death-on-curing protein